MALRRPHDLHENGSYWAVSLSEPYNARSLHKDLAMPRRFLAPLALLCAPLFAAEPVSYSRDVQPILTNKCVACHACYDSPCQLNLGSGEGVLRGANKLPVYDGGRTKAQASTRLY